jgi:hypothetical protein
MISRAHQSGCAVTDVTNATKATSSSTFEDLPRPRIGLPFEVIEPLFALADVVIIVAAGALGGVLYHGVLGSSVGDLGVYAGLGLVASLAYAVAAHWLGLYRLNEMLEEEHHSGRVWTSWTLAILVLAVILLLFKSGAEVSRGSIVFLFLLGGSGLVLSRRIAKRCLRSSLMAGAIRGRRAIVIGTQSELAQFSRQDLLVGFGLDEVERVTLQRSDAVNLPS